MPMTATEIYVTIGEPNTEVVPTWFSQLKACLTEAFIHNK